MLPVVLVPGMLCDERLFGPQTCALGSLTAVSVADVTQDDTITGMAQRVLDNAPDQPFLLAGLSLGGIVAMEVLRLAPLRIAKLVLMATNHLPAMPGFIATRTEQIVRVRQGALRDIVVEELKGHYFSPRHAENQPLRDLVVDMAMDCGASAFELQARALMTRRDQSDTLAGCRLPTLLVAGEDDRLCPVANHQAMQRLMPQAELAVIEGAGHLVTLEAPEAATALLQRWAQ